MSADKSEKPVVELSYEEAMTNLNAILRELESEEGDLDLLAAHVKRASELVRHCRSKIQNTEMEVEKVLKDLPEHTDGE
ncbi:MAG: exodeoxyribonuclease VII small subunit [bacterium]|nr:exodeoxyribonuclease VII small subunit [bacterium]